MSVKIDKFTSTSTLVYGVFKYLYQCRIVDNFETSAILNVPLATVKPSFSKTSIVIIKLFS